MIVRIYARHISTEVAFSTIIADVRPSNERTTMDPKTFDEYFDALSDLYIGSLKSEYPFQDVRPVNAYAAFCEYVHRLPG